MAQERALDKQKGRIRWVHALLRYPEYGAAGNGATIPTNPPQRLMTPVASGLLKFALGEIEVVNRDPQEKQIDQFGLVARPDALWHLVH